MYMSVVSQIVSFWLFGLKERFHLTESVFDLGWYPVISKAIASNLHNFYHLVTPPHPLWKRLLSLCFPTHVSSFSTVYV